MKNPQRWRDVEGSSGESNHENYCLFMMLCGYFVNTFFAYFYIIYHKQTSELFLASRLANLVAVNARSELLLAQ